MACMKFDCPSLQRFGNLIIYLLVLAFLVQSSFNPVQFMAYGRKFPEFSDAIRQRRNQDMGVKMRSMIGSRPPRCTERCKSCGHCEAIQVPIVPFTRLLGPNSAVKSRSRIVAYYGGDNYHSNYKPMCWKCKCGDLIFNP